jgi:hypothetical protein
MSFTARVTNMDYAWNSPSTYAVFVPVLSLLIQKVQMARISSLPDCQQKITSEEPRSHRATAANIFKWHFRGSMLQGAASAAALLIYTHPVFLATSILALYELCSTGYKALNTTVYREYDRHGNVLREAAQTPFNIF